MRSIGQSSGLRRRNVGGLSTLASVPTASRPNPGPDVRIYTQALTVSGVAPTNTEIAIALAAVYTTAIPKGGDIINLTVSGVCKLRSVVTKTGTASGIYVVAFTVGSTTYYGNQVQTGLY